MANEVGVQQSPMERFQENLKQQLRDDIARMLPDEAVKEMIAKVVQEEFFAKRFVDKPDPNRSYGTIKVEQGTKFQDMVFEAAKPILQKLVNEWSVKNADLIAAHWRKVTDEGLMRYVEELQANMATQALKEQMNGWLSHVNQQRQSQGLQPISIPLFY